MDSPRSAAQTTAPSRLSSLQTTAIVRRGELTTRLGVALIGCGLLTYAVGAVYASIWAAAVLVTQFLSIWVNRRFRDPSDARPPTTAEWVASVVVMFVSGAAYSSISALLWLGWGEAGKIFGVIWLCGALLHVTLHMHHDRPQFFAGIASHLLFFWGLPLHSVITGAEPGPVGAAAAILASALYIAHCVTAFKRQSTASANLRAARERALERQAAAEEANRIKGQFLAMMSHELRTPMNGVLGMARLLLASELTPRQKEQVRALHDAGDMLMSILNDVLDISKIEARRIELEEGEIEVRKMMSSLVALWRGRAEEKGLKLEAEIGPDVPRVVAGDPVRVRQVLFNLISNAVKFTDAGGVAIRVRATEAGYGSSRLAFEVADSGCGIAEADIERLFKAFEQADRTTTRRFGGTGLGLAISRELARLMSGDIHATSRLGDGSRFEFCAIFPVIDARPCAPLTSDDFDVGAPEPAAPARAGRGAMLSDELAAGYGEAKPPPVAFDPDLDFEDVTGQEPLSTETLDAAAPEFDIAASGDDAAVRAARAFNAAVARATPEPAFSRAPAASAESPDRQKPALTRAAEPETPPPAPQASRAPAGPRLDVLCAEDQELNRRVFAAMLERTNWNLTFACDGGEAIERLNERRYDLVFMDLQMPELDGIDVTRLTRAGGGPNVETPIIGVTANVLPGVREACLEAGMDDFVGKPINIAELFKAIERVFAARKTPKTRAGAA